LNSFTMVFLNCLLSHIQQKPIFNLLVAPVARLRNNRKAFCKSISYQCFRNVVAAMPPQKMTGLLL